jgi:solute carrier family 6 amino acid transporter-like protein 5/7/9/14
MLFVLGVGSAVGLQNSIISNIKDHLPPDTKYWKVAAVGCSVGFLIGLIYMTPGGFYFI